MNSAISWFNKARSGGAVQRLHTRHTLHGYSNAEHTFNAVIIAKHICYELRCEDFFIVDHLLVHDLSEEHTGDVPSPIKKLDGVRDAFDLIERQWQEDHIPRYYNSAEMDGTSRAICKCADYLELAFYCAEEAALGNTTLRDVLERALEYVAELNSIVQSKTIRDSVAHLLKGSDYGK